MLRFFLKVKGPAPPDTTWAPPAPAKPTVQKVLRPVGRPPLIPNTFQKLPGTGIGYTLHNFKSILQVFTLRCLESGKITRASPTTASASPTTEITGSASPMSATHETSPISITHESATPASALNPPQSAPNSGKSGYHHMPKSVIRIVRNYCHVWDTKGQHMIFRDFKVVLEEMKKIGINPSEACMRRIYNKEKHGYASNSKLWGYNSRPDLTQELHDNEEELKSRSKPRSRELLELEEPVIRAEGGARQLTLPRKYFEDIKVSLRSLTGTPGFGIRTVRVAVMSVWKKNFAAILPGIETPFDWTPSDAWCYRFLNQEMKYSWRRVTGKKVIFIKPTHVPWPCVCQCVFVCVCVFDCIFFFGGGGLQLTGYFNSRPRQ